MLWLLAVDTTDLNVVQTTLGGAVAISQMTKLNPVTLQTLACMYPKPHLSLRCSFSLLFCPAKLHCHCQSIDTIANAITTAIAVTTTMDGPARWPPVHCPAALQNCIVIAG